MSNKKKTNAKPVTMSLNAFLADEATGSWADDTLDLPSMPMVSAARAASSERPSYDRPAHRPSGPSKPLPTEPPFLAYIGNLGYDATEQDLREHFQASKITSVKLLRDRETDRPKGFGYVEFATVQDLEQALSLNGERMQGRSLKVDIAEPPRERSDRPPREPDVPEGTWRRAVPLVPQRRNEPERREPRRFDSERREPRRFDSEPRRAEAAGPRKTGNPFGAAKPVDQNDVLKRVEAKLEAERAQLAAQVAKDQPQQQLKRPAKANPFGNAKPVDQKNVWMKVEKKVEESKAKLAALALSDEKKGGAEDSDGKEVNMKSKKQDTDEVKMKSKKHEAAEGKQKEIKAAVVAAEE